MNVANEGVEAEDRDDSGVAMGTVVGSRSGGAGGRAMYEVCNDKTGVTSEVNEDRICREVHRAPKSRTGPEYIPRL